MRGQTLATVRTLLKAKLHEVQETNVSSDAEFNYALAIKQSELALAYKWGFLEDKWDCAVGVGGRYVDFPTANIRGVTSAIDFDSPLEVSVLRSNSYIPVVYGIGSCEMNARNSDLDQRQDPIQRWSVDTNSGDGTFADQFEVWPIPATAQTLRFIGQRKVRTFASDSDKADLDDLLLVLMLAAEYLAYRSHKSADMVLKEANDHLVKLRAGFSVVDSPIIFGRNQQQRQSQPVKLIAVA